MSSSISALIITLNEETNLPRCLKSLEWCNDIVVLDSYSTDNTRNIAESAGARFVRRRFDDYASQRNFGISDIKYRHGWLLIIDADEEIPPDLAKELEQITRKLDNNITMARFRRRDFFRGHWVKHSSGYPTWFGRFVKLGHVYVHRPVNEEFTTDGMIIYVKGHMNHYPFKKGLEAWFEKHNRYSTMEAEYLNRIRRKPLSLSAVFARDPVARRRSLKHLIYKMPFRPLLIFLFLYIIRGGFLDGRPGLEFCLLRATYEYMITSKMREITHTHPRPKL